MITYAIVKYFKQNPGFKTVIKVAEKEDVVIISSRCSSFSYNAHFFQLAVHML